MKNGTHNWGISNTQALSFIYNGCNKSFISVIDESYHELSDARLKKDNVQMGSVLDKVMTLTPKNYKYISNKNSRDADKKSTGFIAQEVMPKFPNLVSDFNTW